MTAEMPTASDSPTPSPDKTESKPEDSGQEEKSKEKQETAGDVTMSSFKDLQGFVEKNAMPLSPLPNSPTNASMVGQQGIEDSPIPKGAESTSPEAAAPAVEQVASIAPML